MDILQERWELAMQRIKEISPETMGIYADYIKVCQTLFNGVEQVINEPHTPQNLRKWNELFYRDIKGERYTSSMADPAYMNQVFGQKIGSYLCLYYVNFRNAVTAAYEGKLQSIIWQAELFLQLYGILSEEGSGISERSLKETFYYHIHDYDEERMEESMEQMLLPEKSSYLMQLIMDRDHKCLDYLYEYGEYITETEEKTASFLVSLGEEKLAEIASTYTEGYRKGVEIAGIDLTCKKTVQIRYHIGFEPLVRQAVIQFRAMGLEPVFSRHTNTNATGVYSTSPNRQYQYDHRFDDALYMNKALLANRLHYAENALKKYSKDASAYAGPAVIEVFGEKLFTPESKAENPAYTKEQQTLSVEYKRDYSLLLNRFIPQDSYSFTIIAFPIPDIGKDFEDIFRETVRVNTLDMDQYRQIQQHLIDALDQGETVHVTGRGDNHTDIHIHLHNLKNPEKETNFENCLADVNIPVGEVFTSPVLQGTTGILHVTHVYLNGLRYEDLCLTFEDGMIREYTCKNYDSEEKNKQYIRENVLFNRDTLPMGEFAIGTNTTAYQMGRKYDIEAKLPILIAEKTGPHFAVGDTCYSMSEDVILHNPDGKEIIAKENECSALRTTDPASAYFNCHTDITIPYDELGDIEVFTNDGKTIKLIQDGRFVLEGTTALNELLD